MTSLLLLHGAIGSAKQFDALLPLLEDSYDLHRINFPGHGGTEMPHAPFSIGLFEESVLQYISKNNLQDACVFGYSMGGYVALRLAARNPGLISKIFTLATKFDWTPATAERETSQLNPEKIAAKVPAFAASLQAVHGAQWKTVLEKTAIMLLEMGQRPPLGKTELEHIMIPVIISIGELDKMVSLEESRHTTEHLKKGRLLVLPATPHPFEKADMVSLAEKIKVFFH